MVVNLVTTISIQPAKTSLFQNYSTLSCALSTQFYSILKFIHFNFFSFTAVESKCFPLNPCKHGGVCHEDDTSYKCTCATGWTGISCESKAGILRVHDICYLYSTYIDQNVWQTVVTVIIVTKYKYATICSEGQI